MSDFTPMPIVGISRATVRQSHAFLGAVAPLPTVNLLGFRAKHRPANLARFICYPSTLRPRVARSRKGAASFTGHVLRVVLGGPNEQMLRPNAWRVVAAVAHEQAGRDGAEVQLPGVAVRSGCLAIPRGELAVPRSIDPGGPKPALAALINLRPEPLSPRRLGLHRKLLTSVAAPPEMTVSRGFRLSEFYHERHGR